MSLLRQITDALVLSAYHGPAMTKVYAKVDLSKAVTHDLRDEVGERWLGRPVDYPRRNPSPPRSVRRRGRATPDVFLKLLGQTGMAIET